MSEDNLNEKLNCIFCYNFNGLFILNISLQHLVTLHHEKYLIYAALCTEVASEVWCA